VSLTRYKPPIGKSCANCAAFVGLDQGRMEPIGPRGALVFVCLSCCDDVVVAKFGPELAYEPSGTLGNKELSAALERVQGSARYHRDSRINTQVGLTPTPSADSLHSTRKRRPAR
jgi:hypothetical protein